MASRKLPFLQVKDIVEIINGKQSKEFDCIVFIDGKRGLGKSSLAWKICKKKGGFKPQRDITYTRKEAIRSLATNKHATIFSDEMINVAFKRDFYEGDQKVLIKGLNMFRDSCNFYIGCIPEFYDTDPKLRDLCHLRIRVLRRGLALVHRPIDSQFTQDKWDTRNNQKREMQWTMQRNKKPKYSQLSTAIAFLTWKDLCPKDKELYRSIKEEKRGRVFAENIGVDELEGLEDQERLFYSNIAQQLIEGRIGRHELIKIAELKTISFGTLRSRVSSVLDKSGHTFGALCKEHDKRLQVENEMKLNEAIKKRAWQV